MSETQDKARVVDNEDPIADFGKVRTREECAAWLVSICDSAGVEADEVLLPICGGLLPSLTPSAEPKSLRWQNHPVFTLTSFLGEDVLRQQEDENDFVWAIRVPLLLEVYGAWVIMPDEEEITWAQGWRPARFPLIPPELAAIASEAFAFENAASRATKFARSSSLLLPSSGEGGDIAILENSIVEGTLWWSQNSDHISAVFSEAMDSCDIGRDNRANRVQIEKSLEEVIDILIQAIITTTVLSLLVQKKSDGGESVAVVMRECMKTGPVSTSALSAALGVFNAYDSFSAPSLHENGQRLLTILEDSWAELRVAFISRTLSSPMRSSFEAEVRAAEVVRNARQQEGRDIADIVQPTYLPSIQT